MFCLHTPLSLSLVNHYLVVDWVGMCFMCEALAASCDRGGTRYK